jgi:hypothetical protein
VRLYNKAREKEGVMIRCLLTFFFIIIFALMHEAGAQTNFESDILETSAGSLKITFIGHGSLMFTFGGKVIYVDPFSRVADYTKFPKALILSPG